ncbi:glucose-1-phosphate adenylyltransferase [Vibrio jasicida]|uniref:sugar phosphate nucleotidyltransferase n=1 Tax=Vibrio jasicida TaxID=766224 RepID=UPI000CF44BBC|nr:sugar phosphate nucleotidyltransferase [Vibrio jasicida]PQJ71092.1 glucose-1-phosphate adenylyltransferase [Vibrio jasicida]
MTSKVVSIVLADKENGGLEPLSGTCCKSITPFAGAHRLIDFALSNLIQSGIKRNLVLSRFHCPALNEHIKRAWSKYEANIDILEPAYPHNKFLPALQYNWTNALLQNLEAINRPTDEHVLLVGGEQIHRRYLSSLLQYHRIQASELTLVVAQVPTERASAYHVVELDEQNQVTSIQHQPQQPAEIPNKPGISLVLTENYVLKRAILVKGLFTNAKNLDGRHDLTCDVIGKLVQKVKVAIFDLGAVDSDQAPLYWHGLNSVDDYWSVQMTMLVEQNDTQKKSSEPLLSKEIVSQRSSLCNDAGGIKVRIKDSYIASGCRIEGACSIRSVIGVDCDLGRNSMLHEAVLMARCKIGANSRITRAIIEEDVHIAPGTVIGEKLEKDSERFFVTEGGLVVIPKGSRVGFEQPLTSLHDNYPEDVTANTI